MHAGCRFISVLLWFRCLHFSCSLVKHGFKEIFFMARQEWRRLPAHFEIVEIASLHWQPCNNRVSSSACLLLPASKCHLGRGPTPICPPTPLAHTHRIPQAGGHQQLLCIVLTKFKLLLKDLLALLLCYDISTHLDLRLPTWRLLAWPSVVSSQRLQHSWGKRASSQRYVWIIPSGVSFQLTSSSW